MKMNTVRFECGVLVGALCAIWPVATSAETIGYSWSSRLFPSDDSILYEIVLETGEATALYFIGADGMDGAAALPDGRIVGIDGSDCEYWQVMPEGIQTGTGSCMNGVDAGMAYDVTTDTLYAISGGQTHDFESSLLYTVDPDSGQTTLVGQDVLHYSGALAINAEGEAFGVDGVFSNQLYSVNLATGHLTAIAPLTSSPPGLTVHAGGLAFAPDGTLWMTNGYYPELYQLNVETGVATHVSDISVHQQGIRWGFLAIQLPGKPGDMNCDEVVDVADIVPFVLAIIDPDAYATAYPDCGLRNADTDQNSVVNGHDIQPFVDLLFYIPPDETPPTPAPTFATPPTPASTTALTMSSTIATDDESPPVEYYFWTNPGYGGHSSGWLGDTSYTDGLVEPLMPNSSYTYYAFARDSADSPNETSSAVGSGSTYVETPSGIEVVSTTVASIEVAAQGTFTNPTAGSTGLRFSWEEMDGTSIGESGWVATDAAALADGLSSGTDYRFRVISRNRNGETELGSESTAVFTTD